MAGQLRGNVGSAQPEIVCFVMPASLPYCARSTASRCLAASSVSTCIVRLLLVDPGPFRKGVHTPLNPSQITDVLGGRSADAS